jgi:hypothetical protein
MLRVINRFADGTGGATGRWLAIAAREETLMTARLKSGLLIGLLCVSDLAATGSAYADDRLLKLLQVQTLNRLASEAAPTKKNRSGNDSTGKDAGAERGSSPSRTNNGGSPGGRTPTQQR